MSPTDRKKAILAALPTDTLTGLLCNLSKKLLGVWNLCIKGYLINVTFTWKIRVDTDRALIHSLHQQCFHQDPSELLLCAGLQVQSLCIKIVWSAAHLLLYWYCCRNVFNRYDHVWKKKVLFQDSHIQINWDTLQWAAPVTCEGRAEENVLQLLPQFPLNTAEARDNAQWEIQTVIVITHQQTKTRLPAITIMQSQFIRGMWTLSTAQTELRLLNQL